MKQTELKFLFFRVTLIAVCLAALGVPRPAAIEIDRLGQIASHPNPFLLFMQSWPIKTGFTIFGISTFIHVLSDLLRLRGILRWGFAVLSPSIAFWIWQVVERDYFRDTRYVYRETLSPTEGFFCCIALFSIGFTVVSTLFRLITIDTPEQEPQNHPTEQQQN